MRTEDRTKVLVVDDEASMRLTLTDILEAEGFEVTSASDGREALTACKSTRFDVILMDVRMPGIDGMTAFRKIRERQSDARVIMMSAYGEDSIKASALDQGATAFLDKPLNVEKALELIHGQTDTAILVVGDSATTSSLRDSLAGRPCRVSATPSAPDALLLVEQIRFDVIFIDTDLPVMNGLELYLAIKALTPTSIAVMMSDDQAGLQSIGRAAVKQTAYTMIPKPVDPGALRNLLQRINRQRTSNVMRKPDLDEQA